jgi:beta-glucosidase
MTIFMSFESRSLAARWRTTRDSFAASLPCLSLLVAACLAMPVGASMAFAEATASVHPELWPAAESPLDPTTEAFVDQLLAHMTLEEKVGQMIQADIDSITPAELRTYKLGSILAGGNAAPGRGSISPTSSIGPR